MSELNLSDLHNPREIKGILTTRAGYIRADDDDQRFQEYPGSVELWQMIDGKLMRVCRWLKKSVIAEYK